ncbi:4-hydroxyphenylacetate 3-hydroxylase N-terminal domain-containing protein [Mesorhizobium sp. L-8-3]|uniref:4-hydroxyphenylacetate 3-hydroxylase N-terminal domain-containing protein n=1 Tax=Mesorhizobium sp. L-8-3 TaxID=2744522 RepID=UPI001938C7AE|nr:4-hydroxyphenylacetate 3-hydroxylase N-terminal domain-containing protein [Mesorhizobium sp. L-8-3]BCH24166.1 pyoverdin chromophore biosynthetic protein pvcC [Mesorhizobium sp. L-8-3]
MDTPRNRDDAEAFAAHPKTTGRLQGLPPMSGAEYLEELRDGREVYIYGERVKDVTTHPAFRNTARMVARLYDALGDEKVKDKILLPTDTGNGGMTHAYFKAPKTAAELLQGRSAIAEWAKLTYGWLGRAPDYKASFLATLGANAEFYDPYQDNARNWYRFCQERVPYINHAIIHPPVDRDRPPNEVADVCAHVENETDAGIIVSGAKVVATNSVLSNYTFVAHHGLIPLQDKDYALVFMVPTNAPGVKFICRTSYEMTSTVMGSPFDYPLSSRLDENDAVFIMDKVLVPWENVFVFGDIEKANNFFPRTGFLPRFVVHGCTRLAVKLDFISGLLLKAVEAAGTKDYRGVQANVGEVIAWRNLFWSLSDAMVRDPRPWIGDYILPNMDAGNAYQVIATIVYSKIKYIIEQTVASGLIYLNSHALDFKNPELRPYLDRYLRGSNGYKAEDRVKLMKLLWDTLSTEFGGRHELYEINYSGSTEEIRRYCLFGAQASGNADRFRGFAEQCMAEYDLDGWRVPDLTDPGELSYHVRKGAK